MSISQEQPPSPEQQPPIAQEQVGGSFSKDPIAIQEALRYLDKVTPTWILEPTGVTVGQPSNQEEIANKLYSELGTKQDGNILQQGLESNLSKILSMQAQPERPGFGRLIIKAGYNLNNLRHTNDNLTREEYEILRDNSHRDREIIEGPEQVNVMITGLLLATGAKVLRNDIGENGEIKKIYKGMFDNKPVYFQEMVSPHIRGGSSSDEQTTTYLERSFSVVSEYVARHSLNSLSSEDVNILRSIGVELPYLGSSDYNPDTYPNRPRMIEIIQLYATMSLSGDEHA